VKGLDRPSDYLRQHCPLCFGGENWCKPSEMWVELLILKVLVVSVDAIVCIDACFTQKRHKNQGKQWVMPLQHPDTVFIAKDEVAAMEEIVTEAHPQAAPKKCHGVQSQSATDMDFEPGMPILTAVLDECSNSFTAADSNCVKASTQFFADTGLIALLCRHDHVLWLVNMTSAGEKQYYALCLLDKLFQHIPLVM